MNCITVCIDENHERVEVTPTILHITPMFLTVLSQMSVHVIPRCCVVVVVVGRADC